MSTFRMRPRTLFYLQLRRILNNIVQRPFYFGNSTTGCARVDVLILKGPLISNASFGAIKNLFRRVFQGKKVKIMDLVVVEHFFGNIKFRE